MVNSIKNDGTEVAAADVITSIQDAAGNVTGGNSIVNNVGSAIQTQTGGNFLENWIKPLIRQTLMHDLMQLSTYLT